MDKLKKAYFFKEYRLGRKRVLVFKDRGRIVSFLIEKLNVLANQAMRRRNNFTLALSGGSTPLHFYHQLASFKALPWEKMHIFLTDERFVPFSSSGSNYGKLNKLLLNKIPLPEDNIHPIPTDKSLSKCSRLYAEEIKNFFRLRGRQMPRFDFILLGMGEDGHTASLFSLSKVLHKHSLTVVEKGLAKGYRRISLSLAVINYAAYIIFLLSGKNKAKILREVIAGNPSFAASFVNPPKGKLLFVADEEAGYFLKDFQERPKKRQEVKKG